MQSRVLAGTCRQPAAVSTIACKASGTYTNRVCTRSHRLHVVATSEFWWEDEQEFDALTEVLLPKQLYIATPSACHQQLQQLTTSTKFVAVFTAPALQEQVQELWQQLGRAGPPLFLKVRTRGSLQDCEAAEGSSSSAAAAQFLQEVTSQSWCTELDYGLASGKDATNAAAEEQILVIAASQRGVDRLLKAAVGADSSSSSTGSKDVAVVAFEGWNQGATQQQLTSFKQLKPQRLQCAAAQGSN